LFLLFSAQQPRSYDKVYIKGLFFAPGGAGGSGGGGGVGGFNRFSEV
jgi:hypothetical protein